MANRPKYSRWRRLPGLFRLGDQDRKWPDPNLEPTRLSLYLPGTVLDKAEALASKAGVETVQDYCTELLRRAIEAEGSRMHVADLEARQGPLAGLNEIADDPEYLAEWNAQASARRPPPATPSLVELVQAKEPDRARDEFSIALPRPEIEVPEGLAAEATPPPSPLPSPSPSPLRPAWPILSHPAEVVLKHAGQGTDGGDPQAFLPSLRRAESAPLAEIAELARALQMLETEYQGMPVIPRAVAHALHRLALEAQVLHTDAFPGAFDDWTVDTIRAVQEAVDRVLSGQDIRYYPTDSRSEHPR